MHRGLIIATIQFYFMLIFFFIDIPIFNGFLIFGYSTIYTNLPVVAIIMDEDLDFDTVKSYPTLYRELQLGRLLNYKTFFIMLLKGVFQVGERFLGFNDHPAHHHAVPFGHRQHRDHHLHFAHHHRAAVHLHYRSLKLPDISHQLGVALHFGCLD